MASQVLFHRKKSVAEVESTMDVLTPRVIPALEDLFRPELREGEQMPDFELLQELVRRALTRRLHDLADADSQWEIRKHEDGRLRLEVRKTFYAFRRWLNRVRSYYRHAFNIMDGHPRKLFRNDLPKDAHGLLVQAAHLFAWIREPSNEPADAIRLPAAKEKFTDRFDDKLESHQDLYDRATKSAAGLILARQEKKDRLQTFNDDFVELVDLLRVLYRLAGYPGPARTLKPSRQEKGLTVDVVKMRRARRAAHARSPDKTPPSSDDSG